ncbi:hypothetical protein LTR56_019571 [Elasticomyces elasticus]|nr:hypothetical protein LTR56_019571 [Elasticomyces elasticus]KAK3662573.1 hypothetical protein LTR22_006639 [Elasticomyces elasticus]KAK4927917.1 hypothetical protein LTR49_005339 [Elasticomyces elasticus]KAK5756058.1 hypothetical protein LTS12_013848 [Elasticomyces elasticus]
MATRSSLCELLQCEAAVDQLFEPAFRTDAIQELNIICATQRQHVVLRVPDRYSTHFGHYIMIPYNWSETDAARYLAYPDFADTLPCDLTAIRNPSFMVWTFDARPTSGSLAVIPEASMPVRGSGKVADEAKICIFDMGGPDKLAAVPLVCLEMIPTGSGRIILVLGAAAGSLTIEDFYLSAADPIIMRYVKDVSISLRRPARD